jgi:hypothetical protein
MGYLDRFRGMLEIPLLEFIPGGDVPWHRVYYFKKGREVMWDRNTRVDKIFGSGDSPAAEADDAKGGKKGKGKKGSGQEKGASAAPSTAVPEKVRVGPVWQLGNRVRCGSCVDWLVLCGRRPISPRCGRRCRYIAGPRPPRAGRSPPSPSPTRPTEWYITTSLV